jgi:hypothetical protein
MRKLLLFFLTTFALMSCDKDDDAPQTLPEATQTGRGIFACYVNGKPFIDNSGSPNGISFNCYYQLVNGEYYFGIGGQKIVDDLRTVNLFTTAKTLAEGEFLILQENLDGNAWGAARFNTQTIGGDESYTNSEYTGELYITKFDFENRIISGTFSMNIQHPVSGETVEIREGRFDTRFGT